ncbi:sensor histidine kinase [Aestuariimicrobium ganziense]|uniref:sensor histidine kinase n=1 Tax=Aestuariimicrobium ganziense TaxID=2773677 RepID=UPI002E2C245A|nr:sensor histidine kinase [Aestuariimicrobium ganziense]
MSTLTTRERLLAWFGVDEDWERPRPPINRTDIIVALASFALTLLSLELMRSYLDFTGARPFGIELLTIATGTLPMLLRRRYPIAVGLWMGLHFWASCTWVGEVGYQFVYQLVVFYALYCMLAWARDRRLMLIVVSALLLGLLVWLAWMSAMGQGVDMVHQRPAGQGGLFGAVFAMVTMTFLANLILFAAAALTGQVAWRQARDRAQIADQAQRLAEQADQLTEQAVLDERLRLARELHDVVAHHVSAMGVQAAAARRVLDLRPEQAKDALTQVESSSREAVSQMRGLLGALRSSRDETPTGHRGPDPTLAELPRLIEESNVPGFTTTLTVVDDRPDSSASVPPPVQLSLYRIAQEALTNVRRHSSATSATVTLRLQQVGSPGGHAEIEVLDEGRPRSGTSGTGMGQLGMRERIASLKGTAEIGPRVTGGYRVRVRFPIMDES